MKFAGPSSLFFLSRLMLNPALPKTARKRTRKRLETLLKYI